jgi:hypothetical protein
MTRLLLLPALPTKRLLLLAHVDPAPVTNTLLLDEVEKLPM